jgi:hypothetical protein
MTTRRRFLRGAGALIALPALESLMPTAEAGAPTTPRRYVSVFGPNGIRPETWYPSETGRGFTLPPAMTPLAPMRDECLVLTGIDAAQAGGTHEQMTRALLTERLTDAIGGYQDYGTSVDQRIADHLADPAQIHSLLVSSEASSGCAGSDCAWLYTTSWRGDRASSRLVHSRALFERLFGTPGQDADERLRRLHERRSILDTVGGDAYELQRVLGREDRPRLERYLTAIREVEQQLVAVRPGEGTCSDGPPLRQGLALDAEVDQLIELIVLALSCDRTRVLNWVIGSAESYRALDFLGFTGDHHSSSHFYPDLHDAILRWQLGKYVRLVSRLADEVQPGGRRLLDDTFVLYACGLSDSVNHLGSDLPLVLAGGGSPLRGQHLALPSGTPCCVAVR